MGAHSLLKELVDFIHINLLNYYIFFQFEKYNHIFHALRWNCVLWSFFTAS